MPRINTLARIASVLLPSRSSQCPLILQTFLLAFLVCLLFGSSAWGQATTSVRGTVTDPSGNAVVGANVALSSAETKTARNVTTGDQGEYQFLLVPPGT